MNPVLDKPFDGNGVRFGRHRALPMAKAMMARPACRWTTSNGREGHHASHVQPNWRSPARCRPSAQHPRVGRGWWPQLRNLMKHQPHRLWSQLMGLAPRTNPWHLPLTPMG
jgi:hypothetical protein